ncbi:uncharacterized protein K441DRAFT_563771 [Cenococcum geophilum 1.58]|uniref:uncharacterized protein n=1 Tax=Cenococcum geophilum 1.58 TaxID=794803 RepID=UPI00358EA93B|nr:hypothetical protein K441DRAFT_563771 [Cenococcum geophilum 1.58]
MSDRSLPSQLNSSRSTNRQNLKRPRLSASPTQSSLDIIPFVSTGFDETACLVACKRRMSTALKLGERTASVDSIKDLWRAVVEILETNPHDIPFALMYSVHQESSTRTGLEGNDTASISEMCLLEGAVGIEDCSAIVQCFNLTEGSDGLAQTFRTASRSREPQLLQDNESNFLGILTKPVSLDQNLGDLLKKTIVCSIPSIDGAGSKAFLIIGMNPQSPIDDHYWMFVRLLSEELAKSVASVSLLEEERRRKMAAEETALRYASVSKELLQRTQAAESTEHMFRRLSEAASVGCAMFRADATVIWMNRAYCQLTGRSQQEFSPGTWSDVIIPEDRPFVEQQWKRLASGEAIQPFEFRVSRHKTSSTGKADSEDTTGHRWLLSNAIPELNEDGSCRVVMGWLTDISHQKWSEHLQSKRLEDALENKRRSENFIDMTSHEIRNPLSAIIQTADGILTSLQQPEDIVDAEHEAEILAHGDVQEDIVDAANTIILCAQHQKRIVDDILTLSKLDSNLLEVSPEIVQPIALIQRAVRMYEAELQSADIEINVSIDPPYEDLSIDAVLVDPSRVLQVLINLLTNAIKFTQARQQRSITIYLSASLSRPSVDTHNVSYIPQRASRPEHALSPDWGTGEDIYLQYAVEDTGRGLSEEEMKLLFLRFSQTSPKTHSQYGGSGLGLFISRELTELQGGQIGVSSVPGYGTTFTFYIKARRHMPTKEATAENSSKEVSRLGVSEENPAEFVKPNAPLSTLENRRQSVILSRSELEAAVAPLTTPSTRSSSAKYMHVLLVEDNFINQKVMAQQLRRFGCVVHVANNGLEALDVLQQSHFATSPHPPAAEIKKRGSFATTEQVGLGIQRRSSKGTMVWPIPLSVLLMDLEMPVMDGLSCVRRIREMQQDGELRAHVPVIAVTANARSEQIAVAMQTGMDLVLTKPFRIPEVLPQIEALAHWHSFEPE